MILMFGGTVRKMREQHRISQRDLADKLGIDYSYISKFENGHQDPPSEEIIIKMAEIFGVNKYDLIILAGKTPTDFARLIRINNDVQKYLEKIIKEQEEHK